MQAFLDDPSMFISVLALICSVVLPLLLRRLPQSARVRLEVFRLPARPADAGGIEPEPVLWVRVVNLGDRPPAGLTVCGYRCRALAVRPEGGGQTLIPPTAWPPAGIPVAVWSDDQVHPLDDGARLILLWRSRPSGRLRSRDVAVGFVDRPLSWRHRRRVVRMAKRGDWQALARVDHADYRMLDPFGSPADRATPRRL